MAIRLLLFICVFYLTVFQTIAQGSSPLQVIGIDFDNNKGNTPVGWNNITEKYTGSKIEGLQNQQEQPTGYSMEITAAFNGSSMSGLSTGNNSGPVPDAVMATFWYRGNGTASLKFSLDNTKRYRFRFYGGRDGNNDDKSSDYSIGDVTVTLYNWNNVHNEAVIDNVFPSANGEVTVSVKNSPGYTYAILNAITIEEYATDNVPPVLATVPDHTVAVGNVLSIPLSATDPDADPLTFSLSSAANFSALADNGDGTAAITVSPSTGNIGTHEVTVSVSDGNGGAVTASFILTVLEQGAQVPIQVVGIDFDNNKNNTPGGWNNISSKGAGSKIEDLQNRQGQPTGYSMEVTTAFNGSGMGGLSTGNDSGPVPDAVMATFWYKQNGTASMKFTLDNTRRYRFRFYGGRDGNNDDKSSDYGIGDATVTLYNWNNVNNEAIIDNVTPDVNHEVLVSVSNSPGYAYAILNAIT